jgi:hypothetical protein
MDIGDPVIWLGRRYLLRGFDPMSIPVRQAYLEDEETGERVAAPVDEVAPDAPEATTAQPQDGG